MPPSSLIFAVILAVWAAYLMQHWVRRRDHVATARSVDRFSEAMRVLERRHQRAGVDFSTPAPRSYAVSPARPSAPDVVVKRAVPRPAVVAPAVVTPAVLTPAATVNHGGVAGDRSAASAGDMPSHSLTNAPRNRGVVLLVAAAVMVIATGLGMFAVLPWWTSLLGVGAFVATLLAVRASVRRTSRPTTAGAARTSTVAGVRRREAERRDVVSRSAAAAGGGAAAAFAANVQAEAEDLRDVMHEAVTAAVRPPSRSRVYDIEEVEQVVATVPEADVNDAPVGKAAPGTWQPVAVPPPTYTLKAKAPTRVLPSELPTDGTIVAFDEEDEELPTAIRGLA